MGYIKKFLVLVLIIPLLFTAAGSAAEIPKKVAILPFEINAPEDLSYLREGIMDMLASRISWEGKVEAIEEQLVKSALAGREGAMNEAAAREVGTTLGADYVLFGSLTVFGESVSIDAKMIALKEERPPVSVYAQTKGMGEVIPRINDFAQDINNKIFGRGSARAAAPPSQPRFSRAHPETIMSGPAPSAPAPREGGSIVQLQSGREAGSDVFRSQKLSFPVLGMDVGDLDGDGRPEIVVLSKLKEVIVYQWDQGRLTKRGSFQAERRDKLVWVCLVDANHDGKAEVYVSNLRGQRLASYVLEWRGDRLKKLATDIQWYFNRLTVPGKENILLGQKKNMEDIFVPGVYPPVRRRLLHTPGRHKPSPPGQCFQLHPGRPGRRRQAGDRLHFPGRRAPLPG
jgi:TolB-like protein